VSARERKSSTGKKEGGGGGEGIEEEEEGAGEEEEEEVEVEEEGEEEGEDHAFDAHTDDIAGAMAVLSPMHRGEAAVVHKQQQPKKKMVYTLSGPMPNLEGVEVLGEQVQLPTGELRVCVAVTVQGGSQIFFVVLVNHADPFSYYAYFESQELQKQAAQSLSLVLPNVITNGQSTIKHNNVVASGKPEKSTSCVISVRTGANFAKINAFIRWIKKQLEIPGAMRCLKVLFFRSGMITTPHVDFPTVDGWMRFLLEGGDSISKMEFVPKQAK